MDLGKKTPAKEETKTPTPKTEPDPDTAGYAIGADFDVENEYKPDPLIPNGTYHANVTKVKFDSEQQAIKWEFVLVDNGSMKSDGATPVDGSKQFYANWLPKPGDENEMNNNGTNTKRQSKINMMKKFAEVVGIDMRTPAKIISALQNGEWIGLAVDLVIDTREYQGQFNNNVKSVKKRG